MHTVVLLQAAATGNDLNTLVNNFVTVLATPALGLLTASFLVAGIWYSLSPINEHMAMRGRGLIAAAVVSGILMIGAHNWANLVQSITPHGS
jgi:hypothetical protein